MINKCRGRLRAGVCVNGSARAARRAHRVPGGLIVVAARLLLAGLTIVYLSLHPRDTFSRHPDTVISIGGVLRYALGHVNSSLQQRYTLFTMHAVHLYSCFAEVSS